MFASIPSVSTRLQLLRQCLAAGLLAVAALSASGATPPVKPAVVSSEARAQVAQNYGKLPLSFEANQGQTDPQVKFLARGRGYGLYLTDREAVLSLRKLQPGAKAVTSAKAPTSDQLRLSVVGARQGAQPTGAEQLPGTANYFLGNDQSKWHTNLPTYAKVKYSNVYDGIDLVYYGNQGQLEYDFVVAPGADPKSIRLKLAGATHLHLASDGDLEVATAHGKISFHKPVLYQQVDGQRQTVAGAFRLLAGNTVSFTLGRYDRTRQLVIDPVLVYSTYLGDSGGDTGLSIAVDSAGSAYVVGDGDFPPTPGSLQDSYGVFIAKFNKTGSALVYSAAIGGSFYGPSGVSGIAVDRSGDAYITGSTGSYDFPVTTGAFQTKAGFGEFATGASNAFVTKLNPAGSALLYSTYLGGTGDGTAGGDSASGIAVDSAGNAYISGTTFSKDFPTQSAYQGTNKAYNNFGCNAFVTKLNASGSALVYSTYFGGSGILNHSGNGESASGIAIDSTGAAYITGQTVSPDFTTTKGALQAKNPNVSKYPWSAYVAKFGPAGNSLVYSTYLSGTLPSGATSGSNYGTGIAVDAAGDTYVIGYNDNLNLPATAGAFQSETKNSVSTFVSKLNPAGSALLYLTYLNGSSTGTYFEPANVTSGIAVDSSGDAFIVGSTNTTDFPVTQGSFQSQNMAADSASNAFVSKLDPTGRVLLYSTYLGGTSYLGDEGNAIALDSAGNAYVAGTAHSTDFPLSADPYQPRNNAALSNGSNAFVTKFAFGNATTNATATTLASSTAAPVVGTAVTFTATVTDTLDSATPSGSVAFSIDGAAAATETLTAGQATYTTSKLAIGTHSVVATYAGSGPFTASKSATFSQVVTNTDTAAPAFSPAVGTYDKPISVTLTSSTAGAVIHYTTNGTTPSTGSPIYQTPIPLTAPTTIEAFAVASGHPNSAVATGMYTVIEPTSVVIASSANPAKINANITFTATVKPQAGAGIPTGTVDFKVDGEDYGTYDLTKGSAQFSNDYLAIGTHTVTVAYSGDTLNLASTGTLTQTVTTLGVTATPTFTPAPGTYTAQQRVQIADATSGAVIYYTTDGTTPTTKSTRYYGSILVQKGTTINAVAQTYDYSVSKVATAVYSFTAPPTPTFSPAAGTYYAPQTVTISDTDKAATIYYTTDGTTPTQNSNQYYNPIQVSQTETVKAIAAATPYVQSAAATAVFTIDPPPAPTFSPAAGNYTASENIKILDAAAGATIFYTTDGSTPDFYSNTYNGPIAISKETVTIRAFAATNSALQSAVSSATFTYVPPAGSIETVGGTPGRYGHAGDNGPFLGSLLESTQGIVFDSKGNLFIAEYYNNDVRRVDAVTHVITTYAGNGTAGYAGDKGLATKAELNQPVGLALDSQDNLYIADSGNSLIRMVNASTGFITTVAGHCVPQKGVCGTGSSGNGGAATSALLYNPNGVAVDAAGDIYISDTNNQVIRKVAAKTGIISLFAGTEGAAAYGGDNGAATAAYLGYPEDLALDAAGNLYISDNANGLIRKVTAATGVITTFAGKCIPVPGAGYCGWGYSGNSGQANEAQLDSPRGLAFDKAGNLYIADSFNNVVRQVSATTGIIKTVAGDGYGAFAEDSTNRNYNKGGFTGDLGPATAAELNNPTGVAIDPSGNLFLADYQNDVVREVVAVAAP